LPYYAPSTECGSWHNKADTNKCFIMLSYALFLLLMVLLYLLATKGEGALSSATVCLFVCLFHGPSAKMVYFRHIVTIED